MNKKVVKKVINIQSKYLRKGAKKFFNLLSSNNVPLLILSSALGDVIEGVLKKHNSLSSNVHIISNYFDFDKSGKAIGYKGKIVHVFNKDESQVKSTPYFEKIVLRKNVILLGDSLGDLKMVGQIPYDEIIRIGFLVENVDSQLDDFKKNFDVILLGDGSLDFVNDLLKEILEKKK
jgi:5'-nucleotidase